jgi:hypothetical protein
VITLKFGVIVALPERVTVVEALAALPKTAFAEGEAVQPEKVQPGLGVATIVVAVPTLTVWAVAGVIDPFARVPGVSVQVVVKAGVTVAFPENVTVVEALAGFPKAAFAGGDADQPENT